MSPFLSHILAAVFGGLLFFGLFVWLNRKKPELLDKAEGAVRDFRRPD